MKKYALIFLGIIATMVAQAAPITVGQAREKAETFLSTRHAGHAAMRMVKQQPRLGQDPQRQAPDAAYYVFNIGQEQGFVIVSGDDRTPDILGYADQGSFTEENMPDNMRAWLQGYEDQMRWMEESGYQAATQRKIAGVRSSISPLLTCLWNQRAPYNNNTPTYTEQTGWDESGNPIYGEIHCVTGCVATAMAQVMYYHQWPKNPTATIPEYITN